MGMTFLKKYGFYFLLIGVISDFLTPYLLGFFYPEISQMKNVISVFGDVSSPVRQAFLIWSVVSGVFFVLSLPAIYQSFSKTSKILASFLTVSIGLYGIGDCIFTGLFSIDTEQASWTFSTWVHNIGSGLGYAGFFLFPLFVTLLYLKQGQAGTARKYFWFLCLSFFFAVIYGLGRIPGVNHLPVLNQIGLLQRVSFIFNYLPILIFAIDQLKGNKNIKSIQEN